MINRNSRIELIGDIAFINEIYYQIDEDPKYAKKLLDDWRDQIKEQLKELNEETLEE